MFKIILFIALTSTLTFAKDLSTYRKDLSISSEAQIETTQRTQSILSFLSKDILPQSIKITTDQKKILFSMTPKNSPPHYLTSTSFVKKIMRQITTKLRNDFNRGEPLSFDPSNTPQEVERLVEIYKKNFCDKEIGNAKNFEHILTELWIEIYEKSLTRNQQKTKSSSDPQITLLTTTLGKMIEEAQITPIIGKLYFVEVIDGVITRLHFTHKNVPIGSHADLKDTEEISLDLSMLVSVRTGLDVYFLTTLDCIGTNLVAYLEGDKKVKTLSKEMLVKIADYLKAKRAGAEYVHKTLTKLSKNQIASLIELLITLRDSDIPSGHDIDAIAEYLSKLDRESKAKPLPKDYPQMLIDYQFYKQLYEELYTLDEALREEKAQEETLKKVIEELNNKRKNP